MSHDEGSANAPAMLRWHARNRPRKPALVDGQGGGQGGAQCGAQGGGRSFDYRTLDRIVDGACHALAAHGVGLGDVVGLRLGDRAEHIAAVLALGRMGAVVLPLDVRWTVAEAANVAERFGAHRVLTDHAEEADRPGWLHAADPLFQPSPTPYRDPRVGDDTPFTLSLSSGTTGMPKGPLLTHRQLTSRSTIFAMDFGMESRDRFVVATPLYFGGGRNFSVAMIYAGATAYLYPPPYEPPALVEYVASVRASVLFLVPTLMRRLLELNWDGLAFPTLRVLISSGSALYADEARRVRTKLTPNLYQYYSSTEAGGVAVLQPEEFEAHPESVGRPCFGVHVQVVDDAHRPLPPGGIGRLRYRSPASPDRYHLGDGAGAFHEGWFYPGDLASFDEDGFVTLRGRVKDMIIRGGVNIHPADIEQVLAGLPEVTEAAVVGRPSPQLGEEIVAFVVRAGEVDEARLLAACRAQLASFKVPREIRFVDGLPKNAGGKTVKAELLRLLDQPQG